MPAPCRRAKPSGTSVMMKRWYLPTCRLESAHARHNSSELDSALAYSQISVLRFSLSAISLQIYTFFYSLQPFFKFHFLRLACLVSYA